MRDLSRGLEPTEVLHDVEPLVEERSQFALLLADKERVEEGYKEILVGLGAEDLCNGGIHIFGMVGDS